MTYDVTKLRELLERVNAATGPDLHIDLDLCHLLNILNGNGDSVVRYTASTDATISLVECVLPEFVGCIILQTKNTLFEISLRAFIQVAQTSEPYFLTHRTAPLALVGCLLKALIAEHEATESKELVKWLS